MAENNQNYQCSGNCLNCQPAQRAYCACQHAYSNMKVLDKMMESMLEIKGTMRALSEKIDLMQRNDAQVFNPNEERKVTPVNTIAQEGDGA